MRAYMVALVTASVVCGTANASPDDILPAIRQSDQSCQIKYLHKPFAGWIQYTLCLNDGVFAAFERDDAADLDLVIKFASGRIDIADQLGRKRITAAVANTRVNQLWKVLGESITQRAQSKIAQLQEQEDAQQQQQDALTAQERQLREQALLAVLSHMGQREQQSQVIYQVAPVGPPPLPPMPQQTYCEPVGNGVNCTTR